MILWFCHIQGCEREIWILRRKLGCKEVSLKKPFRNRVPLIFPEIQILLETFKNLCFYTDVMMIVIITKRLSLQNT